MKKQKKTTGSVVSARRQKFEKCCETTRIFRISKKIFLKKENFSLCTAGHADPKFIKILHVHHPPNAHTKKQSHELETKKAASGYPKHGHNTSIDLELPAPQIGPRNRIQIPFIIKNRTIVRTAATGIV